MKFDLGNCDVLRAQVLHYACLVELVDAGGDVSGSGRVGQTCEKESVWLTIPVTSGDNVRK